MAAKPTRTYPTYPEFQPDAYDAVAAVASDDLADALTIADKLERQSATDEVKGPGRVRELSEQFQGREKELGNAFNAPDQEAGAPAHPHRPGAHRRPRHHRHPDVVRRGRRDPAAHGSALFERGETQIMGVTTLNMLRMEQQLDTLSPVTRKRYMHNYNFPPYSTGETGRVGSPKRREIGHGALAERALVPVLPSREQFPYAIRQVSEALGSNGSTSMGSVCASTLSLYNAGCRCARRSPASPWARLRRGGR